MKIKGKNIFMKNLHFKECLWLLIVAHLMISYGLELETTEKNSLNTI